MRPTPHRQPHRSRWPALALVLVVGLSACSDGGESAAPDTGPSTPPPAAVEQRGFALPTYTREGYESAETAAFLKQIADTGAEWVQLNPTFYQRSRSSSVIEESDTTPSDAGVEKAVKAAHDAGLKVMLKPHVDLRESGAHRGEIRPSDRQVWFDSYAGFITRYADLGARTGVEAFAVGTELNGLSDARESWLRIIGTVRSRYSGMLTYAANFNEYRRVAFWDAVDVVGVDAYFPLSKNPTTDVAALESAWAPIKDELAKFSAQTGKRIVFTEVGYASQRGATTAPYSWTISQQPDEREQAAGYEALLTAFHQEPWWAGVFWWCWEIPRDENLSRPLGYMPRGKAAEDVVRQWWK